MEIGDSAPDFELEANDGNKIRLESFTGKNNKTRNTYRDSFFIK